jgi:hypothetical protein
MPPPSIVTGPHVSVNTIFGLPLIKATEIILDFIEDVAECKYLDCPTSFEIKYRQMSNHVPVTEDPYVPVHSVGPHEKTVLKELENLERWFNAKVQAGSP